jgi:hypothetical protein
MREKMTGIKVGGNDPCQCGSGKIFKQCCLDKVEGATTQGYLRSTLEGQDFASFDAMQAEAERSIQSRNSAPLDEFHGLSPEKMFRLINFPFDTPALASFSEVLPIEPEAPISNIFRLLVEAIGDKGIKPTARGNLPRALCREVALNYLGEEGYAETTRYAGINKEEDFYELHVTHLVAGFAGFIRKHRGRIILSDECRTLIKRSGLSTIYPPLFRAYVEQFNWAYGDGYEELPFIQQSFLFSLYLLQRYGDQTRSSRFYTEAYIQAFPMLLEEVAPSRYASPHQTIGRCYTRRTLERFMVFFGLATIEAEPDEVQSAGTLMLTKTALLSRIVAIE